MTVTNLLLISHPLCPYVQRAVISLTEKEIAEGIRRLASAIEAS